MSVIFEKFTFTISLHFLLFDISKHLLLLFFLQKYLIRGTVAYVCPNNYDTFGCGRF